MSCLKLYARALSGAWVFLLLTALPATPQVAVAQYDVHPDGNRFVMIQLDDQRRESLLVVIEGFDEELRPGSGN